MSDKSNIVSRIQEIAKSLSSWRISPMQKKDGANTIRQPGFPPPNQVQGYTIEVSVQVPTLNEVFEARNKWVDAKEKQQEIVDEMSNAELKAIHHEHPDVQKSNTIRIGD